MTRGLVMVLTQGHSGKFKVTRRTSAKVVSGHISLIKKTFEVITSHQVAYHRRMYRDFDIRSFGEVQRQWKKKVQNVCTAIYFLWGIIESSYFT